MKRYDSYKDSGIQWLGKIPSHWLLRKSKYLWDEKTESSVNGEETLLSVSQYDGITEATGESRSESLAGYKIVHKDDLVINIMLAWMGGLGVSSKEGIVSPAYCVYRLHDKQNPKYLHYLYKTPLYLAEFARRSSGVIPSRWRMYTDDFGQVLTMLPPPAEQDAIVKYLDSETAKIDEAIAQQQRMIDLLNERKQIIITHAVTRGLNPDVPLRDSGIDWLGDIPSHWKVIPIKRAARIILGKMLDSKGVGQNKLYKYFCAKDVHFDGVSFDDLKEMYFTNEEKDTYRVYNGDLLLVEGGAGAGGASIVRDMDFDAYVQNSIMILRAKENMINRYLFYILQSLVKRGYIEYACNKATIPHFTKEKTGATLIPLPLPEEQQEIVHYIDSQVVKIDEAIEKQKRFIELLQERKQIIINEVVTGKVKIS